MKKTVLISFLLIFMSLIASSAAYAGVSSPSNSQFFKHEKGVPGTLYTINMIDQNGNKIFSTAAGDYEANKRYYNEKFGLGKYWRNSHSPIEPKNIKYHADSSLKDKNLPKVYVK
ncbi:MAG TPA: hypothetical protein VFD10_06740 [Atribacterota bacterium]|nr:hypothetical protein [Atribacterota bacterium]